MFDEITVESKPWSFAASMTLQSMLVAAALTLPMMRVAQLETRMPVGLILPRALDAPEPVRQVKPSNGGMSSTLLAHPLRAYKVFQAPTRVPSRVAMGPDPPDALIYAIGSVGGNGVQNGVTILPELGPALPLTVSPPQPKRQTAVAATPQAPLKVGGGVQAAKLVFGPKPVYPPLARTVRIAGTVRLAATISEDGHIRDLRVISGHPMLISAALEAVRQWVYQPTLLNGLPVEVLTDIEVNFLLQ
jgi:protein TonB